MKVLVITYGAMLSLEWGSRVLPLVNEWGPSLTGAVVNQYFCGTQNFRMRGGDGGFFGVGIGGSLAGRGADLIICDDLVKDQALAQNPIQRDKLFSTFWSEIMSRLEPGGKVIVVMSRRHPEDLSGRLIDMNDELAPDQQWQVIHFPAIHTAEDGTETALWPERYPLKEMQAKRDSLLVGDMGWQWYCLYQNDPMGDPAFKDFPESYFKGIFYDGDRPATEPRFKLMSFDPSCGKDKRMGDFSACLYGVLDREGTLWVDDSFMQVVPVEQAEDAAVLMIEKHRPHAFICETNNFQDLVADNLVKKCHARGLSCAIHRHVSLEQKEVRIRMALSYLLAQGLIRFKNTPGNRIIVRQLREFPTGAHDDGPDALEIMTRLVDYLCSGQGPPPAPKYEPLVI